MTNLLDWSKHFMQPATVSKHILCSDFKNNFKWDKCNFALQIGLNTDTLASKHLVSTMLN